MIKLGIIIGNRGFFPAHLCDAGRKEILATLEKLGIGVVTLPKNATKFGAVESVEDAQKCADLFKQNAGKIDGILVTLPNFGDERGVANALRWSGLRVPVLVHAFNDDPENMTIKDRRDSFCGKMSVCNNLRQYNVPFTLTRLHTCAPGSKSFAQDLQDFVVTCRAIKALKNRPPWWRRPFRLRAISSHLLSPRPRARHYVGGNVLPFVSPSAAVTSPPSSLPNWKRTMVRRRDSPVRNISPK